MRARSPTDAEHPLLRRLIGLENEYALRVDGDLDWRALFEAFLSITANLTPVVRDSRRSSDHSFFTANGGGFQLETEPLANRRVEGSPNRSLIEGKTPECRGPRQTLAYQKAQERLVLEAVDTLSATDPRVRGVLRNARDADGNVFGPQENYEVVVARGAALFLYRVAMVLCAVVVVVWLACAAMLLLALALPVVAPLAVVALAVAGAAALRGRQTARSAVHDLATVLFDRLCYDPATGPPRALLRAMIGFFWPMTSLPLCVAGALCFRAERRALTAFLASRVAVTGTGCLRDGALSLSEKAPSVVGIARTNIRDGIHVFELHTFCKPFQLLPYLEGRPFARLLRQRQRLQLAYSDANRCEVAEYLKLATTSLLLDLVERGALDDAPRLRDPVRALHALAGDATLQTAVDVVGRPPMTALALQRWYQARAAAFVDAQSVVDLEVREVVRVWGDVLDKLERNRGALIGVLDWPTKQALLETAGKGLSAAARQKLALRYHELGVGSFADLEREGVAVRLVDDDEIERAMHDPPDGSPAALRGRLVRELRGRLDIRIDWGTVEVGSGSGARIYQLFDARRPR